MLLPVSRWTGFVPSVDGPALCCECSQEHTGDEISLLETEVVCK